MYFINVLKHTHFNNYLFRNNGFLFFNKTCGGIDGLNRICNEKLFFCHLNFLVKLSLEVLKLMLLIHKKQGITFLYVLMHV